MYGVETFVHPDYQGSGVGGRLMQARALTVRKLNLRGIIAGSLIAGYGAVADEMSAEQYVQEVVAEQRFDQNLSKQLRKGFRVRNLIPDYTDDPRSRNWGVAILWDNPEYRPVPKPVPAGKIISVDFGVASSQPSPFGAAGS
ncbi:MAG: GNAT family N-acetyltransferase [Chloroflexi bacterium]|nr:GNAT family N-acetyltransferase [Chloroflexota bacterium]